MKKPAKQYSAEWWAEWVVDAVATTTQDRRFLRGELEEDRVATEAIYLNALQALKRFKETNP